MFICAIVFFVVCSISFYYALILLRYGNGYIAVHYLAHRGLFKRKKQKKVRTLLWHCTVWSLWLQRNACIFKNSPIDHFLSLTEVIRIRSWQWLTADIGNQSYTYICGLVSVSDGMHILVCFCAYML